jgi:hypothetical protein
MKIIVKPMEEEEIEYRSDFSDKSFLGFDPHVVIKFDFNYGSKYDGENLEFHLTDEEAGHVLDFIKMNLSQERFHQMKNSNESIFVEDYDEKY